MKRCFKCQESKPLEGFYRHKEMADGRLGKCKDCTKADVKRHREENIEKIRAYDRSRSNSDDRRKMNKANYRKRTSTPEGRAKEWAQKRKWAEANKEKITAHTLVGNAIRDGKLKAKPCERCGYAVGVQAHHEDYSKPLDVVWLCRSCHGQRHREINEERRNAA